MLKPTQKPASGNGAGLCFPKDTILKTAIFAPHTTVKTMGLAQPEKTHYSVTEYFELDNNSEIRYEFYDGGVFAMAGTTKRHNIIVDNVKDVLKHHFRPQGCGVFAESVKLEAIKKFYYPYPDVLLTCDPRDAQEEYIVAHPSLIVEVLSKSTADYDKDFKLKKYKSIPSLQYYLIVSQYGCSVEMYGRTDDDNIWTYQSFERMTDEIRLPRLDFAFPVADVYQNIAFTTPPDGFVPFPENHP